MNYFGNAYFVIPVFNEELNVPRLLEDLETLRSMLDKKVEGVHFILVDDGSTDSTSQLLAQATTQNLKVLPHAHNQGPGAAFQTGFTYLLAHGLRGFDLVITLEGDATSDPDFFLKMLQRVGEGDDLVLASPYLYGGGFSSVSSYRLFLSHVANLLLKQVLRLKGLATFSCFYRIYRGQALLRISNLFDGQIVTSAGFECAAEILYKAVRSGARISEIPFRVDWSRRKGKSKMRIFKTSLGYLRLCLKYGGRSS